MWHEEGERTSSSLYVFFVACLQLFTSGNVFCKPLQFCVRKCWCRHWYWEVVSVIPKNIKRELCAQLRKWWCYQRFAARTWFFLFVFVGGTDREWDVVCSNDCYLVVPDLLSPFEILQRSRIRRTVWPFTSQANTLLLLHECLEMLYSILVRPMAAFGFPLFPSPFWLHFGAFRSHDLICLSSSELLCTPSPAFGLNLRFPVGFVLHLYTVQSALLQVIPDVRVLILRSEMTNGPGVVIFLVPF